MQCKLVSSGGKLALEGPSQEPAEQPWEDPVCKYWPCPTMAGVLDMPPLFLEHPLTGEPVCDVCWQKHGVGDLEEQLKAPSEGLSQGKENKTNKKKKAASSSTDKSK